MIKQEIPKDQKDILIKALNVLRDKIEKDGDSFDRDCTLFDIGTLKALLTYETSIQISEEDKLHFSFKHGMDFPEYTGVHEPTKVEDTEELKKKISDFEDEVYDLKQEILTYQNDIN